MTFALFHSVVKLLLLRDSKKVEEENNFVPLARNPPCAGPGPEGCAVLFLQALGQSLQVLQLLIHAPGKLQSLLGTGGGGEVGHRRERKTEVTGGRSPEQQRNLFRALERGGTETYREGHRDPARKGGKTQSGRQRPSFYLKYQESAREPGPNGGTWRVQEGGRGARPTCGGCLRRAEILPEACGPSSAVSTLRLQFGIPPQPAGCCWSSKSQAAQQVGGGGPGGRKGRVTVRSPGLHSPGWAGAGMGDGSSRQTGDSPVLPELLAQPASPHPLPRRPWALARPGP